MLTSDSLSVYKDKKTTTEVSAADQVTKEYSIIFSDDNDDSLESSMLGPPMMRSGTSSFSRVKW